MGFSADAKLRKVIANGSLDMYGNELSFLTCKKWQEKIAVAVSANHKNHRFAPIFKLMKFPY